MAREIYKGEIESLLADGALLVDVREGLEHGRDEGIPGHTHVPLSQINELRSQLVVPRPVIFYCRSGLLSFQAATIVANWTEQPVYYLAGGLVSYVNA
ncbi:MAG: rhodanese-like domain-containing protein [Deltaproteobacteria bacterium]|nr:rhodanese-like domain-containing protein [Deltaproteobacteria bacterium]